MARVEEQKARFIRGIRSCDEYCEVCCRGFGPVMIMKTKFISELMPLTVRELR